MSHTNNTRSHAKPQSWTALPNGAQLRQRVMACISPWWPKIFGYHLLKLGPLSAQLPSEGCSVAHQFSLFPDRGAQLQGDFCHLPLQHASMDAVLMSLLLEFEADPYRILRETDRVLISGGYLLIVGLNPLSPAFIGKLLPKHRDELPWSGRFFLPSRVRDWLGLLGYQVVCDERLLYHSLLGEFQDSGFWQQTLEAWLPSAGSLYLIVARKLETPLTPIADRRKRRQPQWSTAPSAGRSGRVSQPKTK
ncbi:class I SAM-dependent methyltransferase [Shewanella sp. AS16]|uniref:class I SAM-dependent methyltransferase n=1 Tax=Shewanella sp. AS16 TaxID=2907625 RepID=UPI001F447A50|nr:class I SAM-dependent methyltransferase [Shewanella sp. AS16]MCE9684665.1 class I SAM-dependent methyltransferase [Shewanella sp. AS16]